MKNLFFSKESIGETSFNFLNIVGMVIVSFLTLYPFWYALILSFNDGFDALKAPIFFWPRVFTFENYSFIVSTPRIQLAFFNTVTRTTLGTLMHLAFTGVVAYGLSKRRIAGRKIYMLFFAITMYFNGGLIPTYLLIKNLGLLDNYLVYLIPMMWNFFHGILFMAFYETIPDALEDSAHIDGAGNLRIFIQIIVPVSAPIFATVAVFTGVAHWNAWFDTIIYTSSPRLITLQSIMSRMIAEIASMKEMSEMMESGGSFAGSLNVTPVTVRAATLIVTTFPIIVIYPFLQKYFVKGIMIGAVKG